MMRAVSRMPSAYREEAADIRDRIFHARRERLLWAGDTPLAMASGPVDP
jgi:hypothetical protein